MKRKYLCLMLLLGCAKAKVADVAVDSDAAGAGDVQLAADVSATVDPAANEPDYDPKMLRGSALIAPVRGFVVKQGQLHGHSVFSHDACDGSPRVDGETGARNEQCFWDFRDGICQTDLDVLFLTDHNAGLFCDYEYPDELLYEPGQGDTLVLRDGAPVANNLKCKDGRTLLVAAGFDNHNLVLGLERHLRATSADRQTLYGTKTDVAFQEFRDVGHALVAVAYVSDWARADVAALHWDGYEVYNPATNMKAHMGEMLSAIADFVNDPASNPVPELAILAVFEEGAANIQYWSDTVLRQRVFNFIGPNAHRNSLPMMMADGERGDSYRRLFHWFGNFFLLPADQAATADDRTYKAALAAGRVYNAFLFYGYPVGFDFHATAAGSTYEMGAELASADGVTLHVGVPRVYGKLAEQPVITANLLRAVTDGWETVATGTKDFDFAVAKAGVYRVDVRITPNHLRKFLGATPDKYLTERSWVYSGTIYLGMPYSQKP